jgi:hypothetical protein
MLDYYVRVKLKWSYSIMCIIIFTTPKSNHPGCNHPIHSSYECAEAVMLLKLNDSPPLATMGLQGDMEGPFGHDHPQTAALEMTGLVLFHLSTAHASDLDSLNQ